MNRSVLSPFIRLFLLSALLGLGQPAPAANNSRNPSDLRGKYSGASMTCLIVNDFYAVHFSAMQRGRKADPMHEFENYCQEIPSIGLTFLTLDLLDRDARSLPISLRVVQEEIGSDGTPKLLKTLSEVPARVYKNGTLDTKVDITMPGHYALIAEIGGDMITEDDRLRVPFSVALPSLQPTPWLKYMALAASGVVFLFCLYLLLGFYRRYWPSLIGKSIPTKS